MSALGVLTLAEVCKTPAPILGNWTWPFSIFFVPKDCRTPKTLTWDESRIGLTMPHGKWNW